jgi:HEAT repeat protein
VLKDVDYEVREAALHALGEIRTQAALEAIADMLKDPDPKIRAQAADALGD